MLEDAHRYLAPPAIAVESHTTNGSSSRSQQRLASAGESGAARVEGTPEAQPGPQQPRASQTAGGWRPGGPVDAGLVTDHAEGVSRFVSRPLLSLGSEVRGQPAVTERQQGRLVLLRDPEQKFALPMPGAIGLGFENLENAVDLFYQHALQTSTPQDRESVGGVGLQVDVHASGPGRGAAREATVRQQLHSKLEAHGESSGA